MVFENILLLVGGTLSGVLAGLLFIFSNTVVPALRSLKPQTHIEIMQIINVKILNPIFMAVFVGPSVLLALAAFLMRGGAEFPYLLAAAALQIIGVFGITGGGNVPLNDQLEKVDITRISDAEAEKLRNDYHGVGSRWMQLNAIRALAAAAATALVLIACLVRSSARS